MVQIFYMLRTANSKGKKFKPLVKASQRVPLPGKGCEIASMGEGVTLFIQWCCEPSSGWGGNQNKAISRLLDTLMASYLANNN